MQFTMMYFQYNLMSQSVYPPSLSFGRLDYTVFHPLVVECLSVLFLEYAETKHMKLLPQAEERWCSTQAQHKGTVRANLSVFNFAVVYIHLLSGLPMYHLPLAVCHRACRPSSEV